MRHRGRRKRGGATLYRGTRLFFLSIFLSRTEPLPLAEHWVVQVARLSVALLPRVVVHCELLHKCVLHTCVLLHKCALFAHSLRVAHCVLSCFLLCALPSQCRSSHDVSVEGTLPYAFGISFGAWCLSSAQKRCVFMVTCHE